MYVCSIGQARVRKQLGLAVTIQHHIPSLYIHIPFCISKCIYCDFNSIVTKSQVVDDYLKAIEQDLQSATEEHSFETVFIGGGTPTVLNETQLDRLLNMISRHVDTPNLIEYTIEVNPGTLSDEKAIIMKSSHVDRISIGIQSFNVRYLKLLGRIHSANEAKNIF
ncbi:MAG: radical SAM protein, partial [Gammaproteobacteria bacterium]|nr:radical SAM protein [Gammaproteobacteria bacterium]